MDFPSTEAGKSFAILASTSANATTTFHGLDLPLGMDATFLWTLQSPPSAFRGILDNEGDGMVQGVVPSSVSLPFFGSTLYLAAVSFHGSQAGLSSAAVPVTVVP